MQKQSNQKIAIQPRASNLNQAPVIDYSHAPIKQESDYLAFLRDTRDIFKGDQNKIFMPYLHETPKYPGDKVDGAKLWDIFYRGEAYYIPTSEITLIKKYATAINKLIGDNLTCIEFGPGSLESVKEKMLPIMKESSQIEAYIPVDLYTKYVSHSIELMQENFPSSYFHGFVADFFNLPSLQLGVKNPAGFIFGNTIGNIPEKQGDTFPNNTVNLLEKFRHFLDKKGHLIVAQDSNQDLQSLFAAYGTKDCEEFVMNVLYRVERDLKPVGFNPKAFSFKLDWHTDQKYIAGYAIADKPQTIFLAGEMIQIKKGQRFCLFRSYKYSTDIFTEMGKKAGFTPVEIFKDNENQMAIHIWKC